jgi:polysaccharide deacetylase
MKRNLVLALGVFMLIALAVVVRYNLRNRGKEARPGEMIGNSEPYKVSPEDVYIFNNVTGPDGISSLAEPLPASYERYGKGSKSRLAFLLTDASSPWLGLARGLKSMGVPFLITQDYQKALKHRVVLVYPMISGSVLTPEALRALAAVPRNGGTLIGFNVLGGGLNEVFGFKKAVLSRDRFAVRFNRSISPASSFTDEKELVIRLGDIEKSSQAIGTYGYTRPRNLPLASYEDGAAAITVRPDGEGKAYAFGIDLGYLIERGYNGRDEEIGRSYVNQFEPTLDVFLRLIRNIYVEGEPDAVTLGTVPFNKSLSVMITHDVDYSGSVQHSLAYAELEKGQNVKATYFIQTKYIRDYNDMIFFNDRMVPVLMKLVSMGMELGSHSVSHSKVFAKFPLGTGDEKYPSYRPYVTGRLTARNGTILGELRVSQYLIEKLSAGPQVVSFRPGELSNPFVLPQALKATGYLYSSSATANYSLTHLPFQLTYNRGLESAIEMFEFPITVEDESPPKMGERLPEALALAQKIARYAGSFVVLIHPNILGHKLQFEQGFVSAMKGVAWFGTISEFGSWWSTRNETEVDVRVEGKKRVVSLEMPTRIEGLTLRIPAGWQYERSEPGGLNVSLGQGAAVITSAEGRAQLIFKTPL